LQNNYDLAVSILNVRRLIKGYSDTHARGHSKFDKVMQTIRSISQRDDAAMWADRLLRSALKDGDGDDLDGTIKTIQSF
ncbi:MAG: hypothetical protein WBA90_07580, partial [Albidovulum sp.]